MTDPNNLPPVDPIAAPPVPPIAGDLGLTPDVKSTAGLCHFLNFIFLVPLLIYLLKKDSHPFIKQESAEALNFSLTCFIIHIVCSATAMFCIPALISLALFITQIVLGIIGGLKAKEGIAYKYPFSIPMVTGV